MKKVLYIVIFLSLAGLSYVLGLSDGRVRKTEKIEIEWEALITQTDTVESPMEEAAVSYISANER